MKLTKEQLRVAELLTLRINELLFKANAYERAIEMCDDVNFKVEIDGKKIKT